jgi:hypothetical protein
MDDLLESKPRVFRSLRTFWKRSFVQLDDEEDQAFRASLLRANRRQLDVIPPVVGNDAPLELANNAALPDISGLLCDSRREDGSLDSEAVLETGLIHQLRTGEPNTRGVFGKWDYVSHQVAASPFKPVDYMDRMDVFGYRWIEGFKPIIDKYLII